MTSVYQMFKIVTGLIISGFILYFLVSYAGVYAGTQEDIQRALIQRNFFRVVQDVYYTGTPFTFTDFARAQLDISIDPTEPAGLVTKLGKFPFPVPMIFAPGDELFLYTSSLDLGWWRFSQVYAVPKTVVLFTPLDGSDATWELIRKTVQAMPDSSGFEPKVTFGFCNGNETLRNFCGANYDLPCERDYFLVFREGAVAFSPCTARLPKNQRLVTIARDCTGVPGLCLDPPLERGIGEIHMLGSINMDGEFIGSYKDGLDIAAAVFGGTERDIYGLGAEKLYAHKNRAFTQRVGLAARTMARGFELTGRGLQTDPYGCVPVYGELARTLDEAADFLETWKYYDGRDAESLLGMLEDADSKYSQLVSKGCEPIV